MKKYLQFSLLFSLFTACFSCTPEDFSTLNPVQGPPQEPVFNPCAPEISVIYNDLPDDIVAYLLENYPDYEISDITQYTDGASVQFGIELEQNNVDIELLFTPQGVLISSGDEVDDEPVPVSELPQAIIDYLSANYPDLAIQLSEMEVDYGFAYLEIDLSDGTDLYFSLEGNFLCDDDDGDDDDGDDDDGDDDDGDDDDGDDDDGDDDDGDDDDGDDDDGDDDDGDDDDGDDDDGN